MNLFNFGSILGFAEEIEKEHLSFLDDAVKKCSSVETAEPFEMALKECKKRIRDIQRIRRENVTEMILENIEGFSKEPFFMETPAPETGDQKALIDAALMFSDRAMDYYTKAAEKLKGQSEVSRALKGICKKHLKEKKKML